MEKEQQGQDRGAYGQEILQNLSDGLGNGSSTRTPRDICKCYLTFPHWEDQADWGAKLEWFYIRAVTRVQIKKVLPEPENTFQNYRMLKLFQSFDLLNSKP
ncbi:DUF1016 N-terminal domain-containing protein [Sphingobacterium haloxyli]|uniref:hypothetical protein n=1 Tax=Sphingobacterium haloxyli TaxID=2100533 RepID=UPI001A9D23BA|nr:hypothetical protein [Sphingobacterium haloxyli]